MGKFEKSVFVTDEFGKQSRQTISMPKSEIDLLNPIKTTDPRDYILTPRQFAHMAALAGYDDAIAAILAALKPVNIALYAEIKAGVDGSQSFHFEKVLAIISNPAVAPLIPAGVDVTVAAVSANWLAAKDY